MRRLLSGPSGPSPFKNFMAVQNEQFREDFRKAEGAASFVAFTDYDPEMKSRAQCLCAVLACGADR